MIYQIATKELPTAISNACSLVVISADSQAALIRGYNLENINVLRSFQDDELSSLLQQDFWRQPCNNC
jgi:hypothetical protein